MSSGEYTEYTKGYTDLVHLDVVKKPQLQPVLVQVPLQRPPPQPQVMIIGERDEVEPPHPVGPSPGNLPPFLTTLDL